MRRSKSKSAESSIRSLLLIGSAQYPRKVPGSTVAGGLLHLSYLYSSFSQGQIFRAWSFSNLSEGGYVCPVSYLGHFGIQGGNGHKSLFSNVSRCFSCLCQLLQISKTLKRVLEDSLLEGIRGKEVVREENAPPRSISRKGNAPQLSLVPQQHSHYSHCTRKPSH